MIKELDELSGSDIYPFHMPGHKRQGIPEAACPWLDGAYAHDITETDGFDDLQSPAGIIADIEARLASLYGVRKAFLSVNGSTCGNLSAISALVPPGGTLMADRGAHRSVSNAAFLMRAGLLFLEREEIPGTDLTACISADETERKLFAAKKEGKLPDAVLITTPTYEGFMADADRIADIVHEYGLPLIADSAHGAHFTAKGTEGFPGIPEKADVCVVSLHKTLPAMTQVSAVLVNGDTVSADEIKKYINIFQTTSPSYVLMASAERCLDIVEERGTELKRRLKKNLYRLYALNPRLRNLYLTGPEHAGRYGIYDFDKSKINIMDRSESMTGRELYDTFRNDYHIQPEKAGDRSCLMISGIMDTDEGFDRLINAITDTDGRIK